MASATKTFVMLAAVFASATAQDRSLSPEEQSEINEESLQILAKFEPYQATKSDVVFLVDDSGSIQAPNFHFEIDFIRHVSTIFSISEDEIRVAVVTYSDSDKIIRHIDYIKNPVGKNKCSLLDDLSKILYSGGWTDTKGALMEAQAILQQARPSAQRLVVLLTDGQSNRGDPIPVAEGIRNSGIEIIAVGVGNINEDELNAIATSENVFTLDTLSDIEKLAQRIKSDVKETTWDLSVSASSCNSLCTAGHDCCDAAASCSCGTRSGVHQCACQPGYSGQGFQGQCTVCPRGTYKAKYGYLDCTPCPPKSNTAGTGSTSVAQCHCKTGYNGDPASARECTIIRCSTLSAPPGAVLMGCENSYDGKCNFKCRNHYRPTPGGTSERTCLETGQWSGYPFTCTKITCNALSSVSNGNKMCDSQDNGIGTTCTFTCDNGYDLVGSADVRCEMVNGVESWSDTEPTCEVKTCPPLDGHKLIKIRPSSCETTPMRYQSVCIYWCKDGYELQGNATTECLASGQWSGADSFRWCQDAEPPEIHNCPADVVVENDFHKATANVSWEVPTAKDNTGVEPTLSVHPPHTEPPYWFRIGDTEVTYTATDDANLTSTCKFVVTVVDNEPPQVTSCPSDIEFQSPTKKTNVTWELPVFEDNSGDVTVHGNRQPGSDFYWGQPAEVSYRAWDHNNNVAHCKFTVTVKQHTCPYEFPPENGALTCETWLGGQFCTVSCENKHDFVFEPEAIYYCRQDPVRQTGEWRPAPIVPRGGRDFMFPWPDCAELTDPKTIKVGLAVQYYVDSCFEESAQEEIRQKFISQFQEIGKLVAGFCGQGCEIGNVQVHCGSAPLPGVGHSANKRDVAAVRNIIKVSVTATVETQPYEPTNDTSVGSGEDLASTLQPQEKLNMIMSEVQMSVARGLYRDVITENTEINVLPSEEPEFVQDTEIQVECQIGQILINRTCLSCPEGTYNDIDANTCEACAVGWYQDSESSTSCKQCPHGMSTKRARSTSFSDCKQHCKPGTYSATGLETCVSCPRGTYQENHGSKSCVACLGALPTWTTGAVSADFCRAGCEMGSYSDTGYQPCLPCPRGTYQSMPLSTNCTACEDGLTTHSEGARAVQYCQAIDMCDLFPCLNNATCVSSADERTCQCLPGFGDKDCGTNIDDCEEGLCNNGTCIDGINEFYCLCPRGFSGTNCHIDIDECKSNPCLNGGSCSDRVDGYVCECKVGYTGQNCEVNYFDCASSPCQNGGTCFDLAQNFTCCCPPGYEGYLCERQIDECRSSPCQNGGLCRSGINSHSCECMPGFTGAKCETNVDDCEDNLCENGATCVDLVNSYSCTCTMAYTGIYCEAEISGDFDLQFQRMQSSDYAMIDSIPDLYDVTMSFWMRTDDTSSYGTPFSYAHAQGPGGSIVDNALTLQDYNSFVLFINGEPTYTDFRANSNSNWHHVTVTWEGSSGSWKFFFDNRVIRSGTGLQQGQLISGGGILVIGQEQDGVGSLFNAAESYVGDLTQVNLWDYPMTAVEVGSLYAGCSELGNVVAWIQVKNNIRGNVLVQEPSSLCSGRDNCANHRCRHGGLCKDLVEDYECICPDGFGGRHCENVEGLCPFAVCQNGGSCRSSSCVCQPGFTGQHCETGSSQCSNNLCRNGGQCQLQNGRPVCMCENGYTGRWCQYDVNECSQSNGGCSHLCRNTHGSFYCACPSNFALLADNKTCHDMSFCSYKNELYSVEELWGDGCSECRCLNGAARCYDKGCPSITCPQGQHEYKAPGKCCSSCIQNSETCSVSLNGMYHTFDQYAFQFKGRCRYVLAQDCSGGDFSIYIQQENKRIGRSSTAYRKALFIHLSCVTVEIHYSGEVKVAGTVVELPYAHNSPDVVEISRSGPDHAIFVKTAPGVTIEWNMFGDIVVAVPRSYADRVCGLCGNMNSNEQDDLTTRQFLPARTANEFIHSWKVDGHKHCKSNLPSSIPKFSGVKIAQVELCRGKSFREQREARSRCSALRKREFRVCFPVVNPTSYYQMCLEDVCSCSKNELCYCEAITAYIHECRRNGIVIRNWRHKETCATTCPEGMIFDDCGPPCPETCDGSERDDPKCQNQPCVPRCHCPAGKMLHEGACISQSMCPAST